MCYSAEVSLATFLFVEVISIFLWLRNRRIDRAMSLILTILVFMQLLEYLIWTHLECDSVNKTVSSIIPYYLQLQPALIAAVLYIMNAGTGTLYPVIIILSAGIFLLRSPNNSRCTGVGECGHLDWSYEGSLVGQALYYATLIYVLATLKNIRLAFVVTSFLIGAWVVTTSYYKKTWPSVWCHSLNAMAIAAVVL